MVLAARPASARNVRSVAISCGSIRSCANWPRAPTGEAKYQCRFRVLQTGRQRRCRHRCGFDLGREARDRLPVSGRLLRRREPGAARARHPAWMASRSSNTTSTCSTASPISRPFMTRAMRRCCSCWMRPACGQALLNSTARTCGASACAARTLYDHPEAIDEVETLRRVIGKDVPHELVSAKPWVARDLVA